MAIEVKDGDLIEYAREDQGGTIRWIDPDTGAPKGWALKGTLAHLPGAKQRPAEQLVAGRDIPTSLCNRLVEDGHCKAVGATGGTIDAKPIPVSESTLRPTETNTAISVPASAPGSGKMPDVQVIAMSGPAKEDASV